MKQVIPSKVWEQHCAILAKPGRGKSVAAKGGAEGLMKSGIRVGAVDPTAAWWGLRLLADGKTRSPYDMVIFGGDHADIPIDPKRADAQAFGEKIGAIVGGADWSWILDTSLMGGKFRTEFFIGFAEALFATNRRRLNLFLDECHLYIPQQHAGGRAAKTMLAAGNNLVAGGRGRGFCVTMISQRPAKVHKDSLTATESLIVMGMIAPQDIGAAMDWVKVQGDLGKAKDMISTLPALPVGTGWVYAPMLDLMEKKKFPMIDTFDCSAAPDSKGHIGATTELAKIDLEAIRSALGPKKLAAKPAPVIDAKDGFKPAGEAFASLRVASEQEKARSEAAALKDRERAFAAGAREADARHAERLPAILDAQHASSVDVGFKLGLATAASVVSRASGILEIPKRKPLPKELLAPAKISAMPEQELGTKATPIGPRPYLQPAPAPAMPAAQATGELTAPQAHVMRALAWWTAMGHPQPTRAQIGGITGWKVGGSNMRGRFAELSKMGYITYPSEKTVAMTDAGAAVAPEPNMDQTLIGSIRAMLSKPQCSMFDLLQPGAVHERADLAEALGWENGGSNMRGRLSELSKFELIEYPSKSAVKLQDWVQ